MYIVILPQDIMSSLRIYYRGRPICLLVQSCNYIITNMVFSTHNIICCCHVSSFFWLYHVENYNLVNYSIFLITFILLLCRTRTAAGLLSNTGLVHSGFYFTTQCEWLLFVDQMGYSFSFSSLSLVLPW